MKKLVFAFSVGMVLYLSSVAFSSPTRIRFARGATSARVSGSLRSYQSKRVYVIRVRSGQTLTTQQIISTGTNHDITIYITDPAGQEVGDSDASCNNRREVTPTVAGNYRIKVVECQKADEWRGSFRFRVTVR